MPTSAWLLRLVTATDAFGNSSTDTFRFELTSAELRDSTDAKDRFTIWTIDGFGVSTDPESVKRLSECP